MPSREILDRFPLPELSESDIDQVEKYIATSLLLGYDHASSTINLADESVNLSRISYDDAIKFMKNRIPVTKDEWNELDPKLRFRAFTLARLTQVDYIEAARGRLITAMEKGEGVAETWKDMQAVATEEGTQLNPGYWETVYRTNIQTAYNAGKRFEFNKNPPEAIALLVIEDGRTSTVCKPLVGLVLPGNHQFWKTNWPPFHYNCRTTVRRVLKHEIGKTVLVENPSMSSLRKKFKPMNGFGKDPAFGSWWMMHESQVARGIKYGIITEFNRSENVIYDYASKWPTYKRVNGKKDGFFDICPNPPVDWEKNKPAVEKLANAGYQIKVLPAIQESGVSGWKNPDVYVNGILADIKNIEANTKNAVNNAFKEAQKQKLNTLILAVDESMPKELIIRGIDGRIKQDFNKIMNIILIYGKKIIELSTEKMLKEGVVI